MQRKYDSIGVKKDTKRLFSQLAAGMHHDAFVRRLLYLWAAVPPVERERYIEKLRIERSTADGRTD